MKRISHSCAALALVCFTGFCPPANADESSPLSVMQAIERAVAGNPDLRRERVAVAQAAARELEAEGQIGRAHV